jgi:hypothetical protein
MLTKFEQDLIKQYGGQMVKYLQTHSDAADREEFIMKIFEKVVLRISGYFLKQQDELDSALERKAREVENKYSGIIENEANKIVQERAQEFKEKLCAMIDSHLNIYDSDYWN